MNNPPRPNPSRSRPGGSALPGRPPYPLLTLVEMHGRTLDEMPAWHAAHCAERGIAVHESDQELRPYVNHSRWLALCDCHNGVAVMPGLARAWCFSCGATFSKFDWPEGIEEATRLLLLRPNPLNRNWLRSESVADLRAENIAHGIAG